MNVFCLFAVFQFYLHESSFQIKDSRNSLSLVNALWFWLLLQSKKNLTAWPVRTSEGSGEAGGLSWSLEKDMLFVPAEVTAGSFTRRVSPDGKAWDLVRTVEVKVIVNGESKLYIRPITDLIPL